MYKPQLNSKIMRTVKPQEAFSKANEKRNHTLMVIFAIIFFVLAYAMQAQSKMKVITITDINNGQPYACKMPNYPLQFSGLNDYKDTLSLWAIADSVNEYVYSIMLYTEYTNGFTVPDKHVKIWYIDGSMDEFYPCYINKENRTIKYNIKGHSLSNLFHKEMLAIEMSPALYCESLREKRYFMDFFALYDK